MNNTFPYYLFLSKTFMINIIKYYVFLHNIMLLYEYTKYLNTLLPNNYLSSYKKDAAIVNYSCIFYLNNF